MRERRKAQSPQVTEDTEELMEVIDSLILYRKDEKASFPVLKDEVVVGNEALLKDVNEHKQLPGANAGL